jgi:hypothetical protein
MSETAKTGGSRLERYLDGVPTSAKGIVTRAHRKTGGRQNAIKAKCLDCCNWDRDEVANCTVLVCPLHPWRPFQDKAQA